MKRLLRSVCLVLAVLLCLPLFGGCKGKAEPMLTYKDTVIDETMYTYWMSVYKTYYLRQVLGITDTKDALDTELSLRGDDGALMQITIADYITKSIEGIILNNCLALALFDEYGLTLPGSVQTEIDHMVESEIENAGGRKALNAVLAPIGLNINGLRDMYEADEKITYLYDYLYSTEDMVANGIAGAEPITEAQYNAYYEDNFVCVKHIYIRTYDKNVLDEEGAAKYNEDGSLMTEKLTEDERKERLQLVQSIMLKLDSGADFDTLMQKNSMDANRTVYKDGYVVGRYTSMPAEFLDAAFDMEIGEIRRVDTDYATHIMLRLPLPENGWKDSATRETMGEFFEPLRSKLFAEKIAPMAEDVVYNAELINAFSIYDVPMTVY